MTPRTFVSFEADFPTDGSPPGRELAEFIAQGLRSRGQAVTGPTDREGWAWDIGRKADKSTISSIIGFSDDGPRQWQIHTFLTRPFFERIFGRGLENPEELRAYCAAIHSAIKEDSRCRSIRWYDQEAFDRDHGNTWSDTP